YRNGYSGLGYGGAGSRDPFKRPATIRTWKQGIKWAKKIQKSKKKADTNMKSLGRGHFKAKQKLPSRRWSVLNVKPHKTGRIITIGRGNGKITDLYADFGVHNLPDGEWVDFQFYYTQGNKVSSYLRERVYNYRPYPTMIRKRRVPKNAKLRVSAWASCPGVRIAGLSTEMTQ